MVTGELLDVKKSNFLMSNGEEGDFLDGSPETYNVNDEVRALNELVYAVTLSVCTLYIPLQHTYQQMISCYYNVHTSII